MIILKATKNQGLNFFQIDPPQPIKGWNKNKYFTVLQFLQKVQWHIFLVRSITTTLNTLQSKNILKDTINLKLPLPNVRIWYLFGVHKLCLSISKDKRTIASSRKNPNLIQTLLIPLFLLREKRLSYVFHFISDRTAISSTSVTLLHP